LAAASIIPGKERLRRRARSGPGGAR
jgi:hypothetical protein